MSSWKYKTAGIPDIEFIRGKVPMTKSEVRAVCLSKLKLNAGLNILDIGAGTGSVTIECGVLGSNVVAIERNPQGVELIKANIEKFELNNIKIIKGSAPSDLPKDSTFNRVFIGGSGGKIDGVFNYLNDHLEANGILVANTITIENNYKILSLMEEYGYKDVEVVSINISRSSKVGSVHMMKAENPISIISGIKGK